MDQAEYFELCRRVSTDFVSQEADKAKVVWAKLRSFPSWPAQVLSTVVADKRLKNVKRPKEDALPVMFFKDCTVAWVASKDIVSWSAGMQKRLFASKPVYEAVKEVHDLLTWERRSAPQAWWCKPPAIDASAAAQAAAAPLPSLPAQPPVAVKKPPVKIKVATMATAPNPSAATAGKGGRGQRSRPKAGAAGAKQEAEPAGTAAQLPSEGGGEEEVRKGAATAGSAQQESGEASPRSLRAEEAPAAAPRAAAELSERAREEGAAEAPGGMGVDGQGLVVMGEREHEEASAPPRGPLAPAAPAAAEEEEEEEEEEATAGGASMEVDGQEGGAGSGLRQHEVPAPPLAPPAAAAANDEAEAAHQPCPSGVDGEGRAVCEQEPASPHVPIAQAQPAAAAASKDEEGGVAVAAKAPTSVGADEEGREAIGSGADSLLASPHAPSSGGRAQGGSPCSGPLTDGTRQLGCAKCRYAKTGCKRCRHWLAAQLHAKQDSSVGSGGAAGKAKRAGMPSAGVASPSSAKKARHSTGKEPSEAQGRKKRQQGEAGAAAQQKTEAQGRARAAAARAQPAILGSLSVGVAKEEVVYSAAAIPTDLSGGQHGPATARQQQVKQEPWPAPATAQGLPRSPAKDSKAGAAAAGQPQRAPQLTLRDTLRSVINKLKLAVPALRGVEAPNDTPSLVVLAKQLFGEALDVEGQRGRTWMQCLATMFSWAKGQEVTSAQVEACFPATQMGRILSVKVDQEAVASLGLDLEKWEVPLRLEQVRSITVPPTTRPPPPATRPSPRQAAPAAVAPVAKPAPPAPLLPGSTRVDKGRLSWEACDKGPNCVKPRGHMGWCIQSAGGAAKYVAAGGPLAEAKQPASPSPTAQRPTQQQQQQGRAEAAAAAAAGKWLEEAGQWELPWEKCSKEARCIKPVGHCGWCIKTLEGARAYLANGGSSASKRDGQPAPQQVAPDAGGAVEHGKRPRRASGGPSAAALMAMELDTDDAEDELGAAAAEGHAPHAKAHALPVANGRVVKRKPERPPGAPVLTAMLQQAQQDAGAGAARGEKCSLHEFCSKPTGHTGFCIKTAAGAAAYTAAAAGLAPHVALHAQAAFASPQQVAGTAGAAQGSATRQGDAAMDALKNKKPQYVHIKQNVWVSKPRPKRLPRDEIPVCNCRAGPSRVARSARQLMAANLAAGAGATQQPPLATSARHLARSASPPLPAPVPPAWELFAAGPLAVPPAATSAACALGYGLPVSAAHAAGGGMEEDEARLAARQLAEALFAPYADPDAAVAKRITAAAFAAAVAAAEDGATPGGLQLSVLLQQLPMLVQQQPITAACAAGAAAPGASNQMQLPGVMPSGPQLTRVRSASSSGVAAMATAAATGPSPALAGGVGAAVMTTRRGVPIGTAAAVAAAAAGAAGATEPLPRDGCGENCLNRLSFIHCDQRTCPCTERCSNRPFALLDQPEMEVFLTEDKGWGVRANARIPRSTFIVEYAGEVIDDKECQRRAEDAKRRNDPHFYMMEMAPGMIIDARVKGNVARLLNSSCDPNCETQKWHDAGNGEIRVGIFTLRDIEPGEELTYDYQFQHFGLAAAAGAYLCKCGAANCRGTMDTQPERTKDFGRRIEVWWPTEQQWFAGFVTGYSASTRRHTIKYDDGDVERVALSAERFRWLDEYSRPTGAIHEPEAAALQQHQPGRKRARVNGSGGGKRGPTDSTGSGGGGGPGKKLRRSASLPGHPAPAVAPLPAVPAAEAAPHAEAPVDEAMPWGDAPATQQQQQQQQPPAEQQQQQQQPPTEEQQLQQQQPPTEQQQPQHQQPRVEQEHQPEGGVADMGSGELRQEDPLPPNLHETVQVLLPGEDVGQLTLGEMHARLGAALPRLIQQVQQARQASQAPSSPVFRGVPPGALIPHLASLPHHVQTQFMMRMVQWQAAMQAAAVARSQQQGAESPALPLPQSPFPILSPPLGPQQAGGQLSPMQVQQLMGSPGWQATMLSMMQQHTQQATAAVTAARAPAATAATAAAAPAGAVPASAQPEQHDAVAVAGPEETGDVGAAMPGQAVAAGAAPMDVDELQRPQAAPAALEAAEAVRVEAPAAEPGSEPSRLPAFEPSTAAPQEPSGRSPTERPSVPAVREANAPLGDVSGPETAQHSGEGLTAAPAAHAASVPALQGPSATAPQEPSAPAPTVEASTPTEEMPSTASPPPAVEACVAAAVDPSAAAVVPATAAVVALVQAPDAADEAGGEPAPPPAFHDAAGARAAETEGPSAMVMEQGGTPEAALSPVGPPLLALPAAEEAPQQTPQPQPPQQEQEDDASLAGQDAVAADMDAMVTEEDAAGPAALPDLGPEPPPPPLPPEQPQQHQHQGGAVMAVGEDMLVDQAAAPELALPPAGPASSALAAVVPEAPPQQQELPQGAEQAAAATAVLEQQPQEGQAEPQAQEEPGAPLPADAVDQEQLLSRLREMTRGMAPDAAAAHYREFEAQLAALSRLLDAMGPDPQVDNPGAEAVAGRLHGNGKGTLPAGHRPGSSRGAGGARRLGGGTGGAGQGGTRSRRTIRPPSRPYGDDFEHPSLEPSDASEEEYASEDEEEYELEEEEEDEEIEQPESPPRRFSAEARQRATVAASMSPATQAAATIAALAGLEAGNPPARPPLARRAPAPTPAPAQPTQQQQQAEPQQASFAGAGAGAAGGALSRPGRRHPTPPSTGLPARTILVAKKLTNSDVTKGRILLPRAAVEANLSFAIGRAHSLAAQDHLGRAWEFTLQSWANGMESRRVYVLEHAGEFVRAHALKPEDVIGISSTEAGSFLIEYNTDEVCNAAETQAAARPGQAGHSPMIPGTVGVEGGGHNPLIQQNAGRCARSEYCNKPAGHPGFCTRTPAGAAASSAGRAARRATSASERTPSTAGTAPREAAGGASMHALHAVFPGRSMAGMGPPPGAKRKHRLLAQAAALMLGGGAGLALEAGRPKRARKLTEKAAAMGETLDDEEDAGSGYETPTHTIHDESPVAAAAPQAQDAEAAAAGAAAAAAVPPIFVMAASDSGPSAGGPLRSPMTRPSSGSLLAPQGALPGAPALAHGLAVAAGAPLGLSGMGKGLSGMGKLIPSPVQPPVLSPLPALSGPAPLGPPFNHHHLVSPPPLMQPQQAQQQQPQQQHARAPQLPAALPAAAAATAQQAVDVTEFLAPSSPEEEAAAAAAAAEQRRLQGTEQAQALPPAPQPEPRLAAAAPTALPAQQAQGAFASPAPHAQLPSAAAPPLGLSLPAPVAPPTLPAAGLVGAPQLARAPELHYAPAPAQAPALYPPQQPGQPAYGIGAAAAMPGLSAAYMPSLDVAPLNVPGMPGATAAAATAAASPPGDAAQPAAEAQQYAAGAEQQYMAGAEGYEGGWGQWYQDEGGNWYQYGPDGQWYQYTGEGEYPQEAGAEAGYPPQEQYPQEQPMVVDAAAAAGYPPQEQYPQEQAVVAEAAAAPAYPPQAQYPQEQPVAADAAVAAAAATIYPPQEQYLQQQEAYPAGAAMPQPQAYHAASVPQPEAYPAAAVPQPQAHPAAAVPQPQAHPAAAVPQPQAHPAAAVPQPQAYPAPVVPQPQAYPAPVVPQPQAYPAAAVPQAEAYPAAAVPQPEAYPAAAMPQPEAYPAGAVLQPEGQPAAPAEAQQRAEQAADAAVPAADTIMQEADAPHQQVEEVPEVATPAVAAASPQEPVSGGEAAAVEQEKPADDTQHQQEEEQHRQPPMQPAATPPEQPGAEPLLQQTDRNNAGNGVSAGDSAPVATQPPTQVAPPAGREAAAPAPAAKPPAEQPHAQAAKLAEGGEVPPVKGGAKEGTQAQPKQPDFDVMAWLDGDDA